MKKIFGLALIVLLVAALMASPSSVVKADDDCKGCTPVKEILHCGPIGPNGLRLCSRTTFPAVSTVYGGGNSDKKGSGTGQWSGRQPLSIQPPADPKPTGYTPAPFGKRDCIKTLSCLPNSGNGKRQ